jgi:multisubunit Na+/H+ antiporter MnhC subunit
VMDSRGTPLFEPKVSAFVCTATVVLFALAVVGLVTLVRVVVP